MSLRKISILVAFAAVITLAETKDPGPTLVASTLTSTEHIATADVTPDATNLLTGSVTDAGYTLRLWDVNTGLLVRETPIPAPPDRYKLATLTIAITAVANDQALVSTSDSHATSLPMSYIWNLKTGSAARYHGKNALPDRSDLLSNRLEPFSRVRRNDLTGTSRYTDSRSRFTIVRSPSGLTMYDTRNGNDRQVQTFPSNLKEIWRATMSNGILAIVTIDSDPVPLIELLRKRPTAHNTVRIFDLKQQHRFLFSIPIPSTYVQNPDVIALSPDGKFLALALAGGRVELWDITRQRKLRQFRPLAAVETRGLAISPDNQWVVATVAPSSPIAAATGVGYAFFWHISESQDDRPTWRLKGPVQTCVTFSNKDGNAVMFSPSGLRFVDPAKGKEVDHLSWTIQRYFPSELSPHLFRDASCLASRSGTFYGITTTVTDGSAQVFETMGETSVKLPHGTSINSSSLTETEAGTIALTIGVDGLLKLWRISAAQSPELLLTFATTRTDSWIAASPNGRFDTDELWIEGTLSWRFPSTPQRALAVEAFMRDFFAPSLTNDVLMKKNSGRRSAPLKTISQVPARIPRVSISFISTPGEQKQARSVLVTLKLEGEERFGRASSSAYEVWLYRDRQVVSVSKGSQTSQLVRLPSEASSVEFAAFAINKDGIRGPVTRQLYTSQQLLAKRQSRAFVLSIGVEGFGKSALKSSPVNAENVADSWLAGIQASGQYVVNGVERVVLRKGGPGNLLPTKTNVEAQLKRLEHVVGPDDDVFIFFSTHGQIVQSELLLLTEGKGAPETLWISSAWLADRLRPIDSHLTVVVLDACYSGAAILTANKMKSYNPGVERDGFGQIAYSRRMLVLTSASPWKKADVSVLVPQLLDGAKGPADQAPTDGKISWYELFKYVTKQFEAMPASKKIELDGQMPYLADFSKGFSNKTAIMLSKRSD